MKAIQSRLKNIRVLVAYSKIDNEFILEYKRLLRPDENITELKNGSSTSTVEILRNKIVLTRIKLSEKAAILRHPCMILCRDTKRCTIEHHKR